MKLAITKCVFFKDSITIDLTTIDIYRSKYIMEANDSQSTVLREL